MAQTYEQWKKSYESLDDSQKKLYADTIKSKGADYIGNQYLSQYNSASASTSTPQNTSSNTVTETYRGQVSDGTSGMNSMSQSKAQENSSNAQVNTGDVVEMQGQRIQQLSNEAQNIKQQSQDNFATSWNSLSAAQQQAALTKKGMLDYVNSKGLTVKKEETPVATTTKPKQTTYITPKQQEWDYQDNSQARMDEIARNLNGFRQTNPELFQDPSTFYGFFIDGKGRSQDQIDYLWDYFNNVQKYGKYDNMSPDAIGNGIANGTIPQDYLNYLKANDPAKYQEVMNYKQEAEDTIKYESYLQSTAELAGIEGWESEKAESVQYGEFNGIWLDEDNNRVDDRREHYATPEEQGYQKQIADLNAANLDIDNTVKHTYDDLVERYPGASKATLMAMAQDINSDLLREKENNLVELTRLQGYVSYMQAERFEMNQAGADSIAQLQKNLGMYYQYSPAGLSELAQAQYAATNVTLDQADNGTETQKQMAVEKALQGYYDKYGSIIQRSMGQAVNDIIAYAKKNGIGLAQALQENFVKPLQAKPGFDQLNTVQNDPYVVKVGDVAYRYNPATDEFELIGGSGTATGSSSGTTYTGKTAGSEWSNGNQVKLGETAVDTGIKNVYGSNVKLAPTVGNMLQEAVDNLKSQGIDLQVGDSYRSYETQKRAYEEDQAKPANQRKGVAAPGKSFHELGQAIDVAQNQMNDPKVIQALLDAGFTRPVKSEPRHWSYGEGVDQFGGVAKKDAVSPTANNQNSKYGNKSNWNNDGYSNNLVKEYEAYLADPGYETKSDLEYKLSSYGIGFEDFTEQAQNYARTGMKDKYVDAVSGSLEAAIELYEYINGNKAKFEGKDMWNWSSLLNDMFRNGNVQAGLLSKLYSYIPTTKQYDAKSYFNSLNNRETLQKLIETKQQGATYGAMSEGEWKLLASAANMLDWGQSGAEFQKNLENLIYSLSTAVEQGGGSLPTNYWDSTARKMLYVGNQNGRWDVYKNDNTPGSLTIGSGNVGRLSNS